VNDATLQCVAAGANGDIRLVLGQLQMIRLRSTHLSYDDAKVGLPPSPPPFKTGKLPPAGQFLPRYHPPTHTSVWCWASFR